MSPTRIYVVINKTTGEKRLIETTSQERAIRHCVNNVWKADVASAKTLAHYMGEGLKVEITDTATTTAQTTT